MENTKSNINNEAEEKYIRELFSDYTPDEAPARLKQKLMNEILQEWSQQPAPLKKNLWVRHQLWAVPVIVIMTIAVLWIDMQQNSPLTNMMGLTNPLSHVTDNINRVFAWMTSIPSVLIYTTLVVGILLGADQLFSKLKRV
jgi:preprotein translocase subunit SecE